MGDLVLLGLAVGLFVVVASAPLERAVLVTVPSWLLLPAPLVVPNPLTSLATFHRLLLVALVVAWWRGRNRGPGLASPSTVLSGPLAGPVIALVLLVALVVGPAGVGPEGVPANVWVHGAAAWVDRLVTLVVVALVAAELAARDADAVWVVPRALVVAALLTAVVALTEVATGRSWGAALFRPLASLQGLDAAGPLEGRGGMVRVRAGSEFALELGWVAVAMLPAALACAVDDLRRRWRWMGRTAVVLLPVVVAATQSRSALAAIPVVVLVWVLLARLDPSVVWTGAVAVLLGAGMLALAAVDASEGVQIDAPAGSVQVREERLELLTDAVSDAPVAGLGVGAAPALGLPTTDSSYLQVYAELGVLGLGLLVVAVVAGLAAAVPGLVVVTPTRPVAVAAVLGAAALVGGSFAYDALTLQGSSRLAWALVGVAGALPAVTARTLAPSVVRVVAASMVVAVGIAVAGLMPRVASVDVRFLTLGADVEVGGGDPVVPFGRTATATTCEVVRAVAAQDHLGVRCRDEGTAAGMGRYRLTGPSPEVIADAVTTVHDQMQLVDTVTYRDFTIDPITSARPVWVTTAPVTGIVAGLGLLLLPSIPRSERLPRHAARASG